MENITMVNLTQILAIIGVLTLIVNVITQVLKKTFCWKKEIPTQLVCVGISLIITIISCVAFCQIKNIEIVWYMVFAFVVLGFFVAYAAMFGFDTLKEIIDKYTK